MNGPKVRFQNAVLAPGLDGNGPDYFRPPNSNGQAIGYPLAPQASITPARVTQSVRMRFNAIRGLTAEKITRNLDQWQLGFFREAGIMWDAMERRDYQLKIVAPKRKKAVARHGYDILSLDKLEDSKRDLAQEQVKFLKYFWDNASATSAIEPDEQGGVNLLARQMMDCVGKRYAVHELVYQPQADGSLTAKFIFCPIWWFEGTRGKLRFLENEFNIYGLDLEEGEWMVTVGDGIMEACAVVYWFKHAPIKSWLNFLDKFGMPGVHGQTDAEKGSKEWNDFVDAVNEFAEEWAAVTNRSAAISLVEAKSTQGSGDTFATLVEKMDRAITQLWRGGDLGTTASKDATGASLQGDESDILEGDDAVLIEASLARVSKWALQWKFGPEVEVLAYLKFKQEQDPDAVKFQREIYKQFATNGTVVDVLANQTDLKKLTQDVGLPVNEKYVDPYLSVRDNSGALITGELLKDSEGDVIGAVPQAPATAGEADPANPNDPKKNNQAKGKPSEIVNDGSRPDNAPSAKLEENSIEAVAKAVASDLSHVLDRLAAIQSISNPELMEVKLRKFLADLDQLKADVGHDPETAHAIQKVLASAFVNGAQIQNGDVEGHEFHGNQWTEAGEGEYYHGTSGAAAEKIAKTGIRPTDKTLGFKAAFVGKNKDLAFAYGSGAAGMNGDKEVAVVVVKTKAGQGFYHPKGTESAAFKPGKIGPENIDRIEYYSKDAKKGDAPLRVQKIGNATVANGDVEGHEFHGNQWTEAQSAESGRLRKEADTASQAADDTEFRTAGATDEQKAEAHQTAAEKYKAVAEHAKASGDAYAARIVGKRMREKAQYHKDAAHYYSVLKKKTA